MWRPLNFLFGRCLTSFCHLFFPFVFKGFAVGISSLFCDLVIFIFFVFCLKKNSARAPETNKADNYLTSNCLWNWWLGRDWVRSSIFIQRRCWRQTFATLSVIPPAATSFSNARANEARRIPALRRRLILFLTSVFFTWPTYLSCLPRCPLKPSCKLFQMCALPFTCTRPISLSVRTKPSINCLC